MDQEIVAQLLQIKWLLAVFVSVVIVRQLLRACWEFRRSGGIDALSKDIGFPHRLQALLERGKNDDALALAQKRCREYPGDALAFWFHATAAYRVGKLSEAVASLRRAQELQPDWGSTHVRPFIEAIEAGGTPPKAELYVVNPLAAIQPAAPPT